MPKWKRSPRRRRAAHLVAGACVVLAAAGGFVGALMSHLALYPACEASYSEATIVAPASHRGRFLCSVASDRSFGDDILVPFGLMAAPVLLALVGLLVWVVFKRFVWLLPVLVVALLFPWVMRGAVLALPPDCTAAQWDDHGAAGCERDEEQRPGIGQYSTGYPTMSSAAQATST